MIKKLILTTALLTGLTYGTSFQHDSTVTSVSTKNDNSEKINLSVWNPPLGKKESGDSCKDGNCITDLNLCQKDGPMYKVVSSVRNEMKRLWRRL